MPVVVEYLLIVKEADTFCGDADAFTALLNVDSSISIEGAVARFDGGFSCDYAITSGDIKSKSQRFFHVRFSANDCKEQEDFDRFAAFLKVVRSIMNKVGGQPETLWNDISFHYSTNAYRLIHRVENLMRKLIANFMLVTVGAEWVDESSPKEIKEAIGKSKRKGYLNVLHSVDFIHLADFLLRPYSATSSDELVKTVKSAKTTDDLERLKLLLPQSNWSRYFSVLVECDDTYLSKRWDQLYDLRCKVAHNAIVNKMDFDQIAVLVGELEGKLEDAITKLPQVEVPQTEVEQVAEDAASRTSELMGDFISAWRLLEGRALLRAEEFGVPRKMIRKAIELLHENGVLSTDQTNLARHLSDMRNHIVHPTGLSLPENEIRESVGEILSLIEVLGGYDDPEAEAEVSALHH